MTDKAPSTAPVLPIPDAAGGEAALHRWSAKAAALPAESVVLMTADGRLAMWNVARALEGAGPHIADLKSALPKADWATIEALADLALATAHAEALVDRAEPADHGLPGLRARVAEVRGQMLSAAEMLADFGKLSAAQISEIRKGRGAGDSANDAGVLAQLFRDNWATVQGLTPVTKELVEEAGEVGAKLLQLLKPGAGKGAPSQQELEKLRDQRNRLWTLLVAGHSELSAAAYWKWREGYRAHVPALQGRAG